MVADLSLDKYILPAAKTKTNEARVLPIGSTLRAELEMRRHALDGKAENPGAIRTRFAHVDHHAQGRAHIDAKQTLELIGVIWSRRRDSNT